MTSPQKNLVNGFTQTTAGVNALDAAAGKTLNDKFANYLPLADLPLSISRGGTGENQAWEAAKAFGVETRNMSTGIVDTLKIVNNIAILGGRRGANAFLCLLTYWDGSVTYIYTVGSHPTIAKAANNDTFTITNDAGRLLILSSLSPGQANRTHNRGRNGQLTYVY